MQHQRIRTGLIGYGYAGRTFHAPLLRATPALELTTIVSSDEAKVLADQPGVQVLPDPEALVSGNDIDLVVIATPNDSHARLADLALQAGKHVVIDKPFVLTVDQGRQLIAKARDAGRTLSVFHNRRWDSDFLAIRQALAEKRVGGVSQMESQIGRFRPLVRDRWREKAVPGSGLLLDLGPHLIDQALVLFGLPEYVHASLATQRRNALTNDWFHLVFEYQRIRVILQSSMLAAYAGHRLVLHGDKGSIVKHSGDVQERQLVAGLAPGAPGWGQDRDPPVYHGEHGQQHILPSMAGDYRDYYAQLALAIQGAGDNPVPAQQALAGIIIIDAAMASAATGQRVALSFSDQDRLAWKQTAT